ncbi:YbaY family lipoprotein [Dethiosulfovibrio salsuginis]|uniref:Putative lipoprotein n=1 Tax=Dethiosulfovibrio salsuginis TaxID=561720 RepID=A0A1X7LCJ0_9BACT|nr:YbaY family lipoprotein [Dethiosulfovibrio salsuginis]SMG51103.1 putative lipoprotein [Dethiosulfovibrio salsuginis]
MIIGCLMVVVAVFLAAELYDHDTIVGEVAYRERIALPEGCSLVVAIFDVTPGSPRKPVASVSRTLGDEQVPLPFKLIYRPSVLVEGRDYALYGRIESPHREIMFVTLEPVALPLDGQDVAIWLKSAK